jgi:catechol 2,3-dioxygenase-like lactoylglutathione lyase family enzyme
MSTAAATPAPGSSVGFINGLTLSLSVRDLERSKRFYRDVLGFIFSYEVAEIAWAGFHTPTKDVMVGLSQVEEVKPNSGLVPTFNVSDLEATRAKLEAHQVSFDGPTQTLAGVVKLATFFDPDGHPFRLSQSLGQPG